MVPVNGRDHLRYPLPLRLLHWTRAALVSGMIAAGWLMTSLADATPLKYGTLYPTHKSFGLLVLGLVVAQIAIRLSTTLPPSAPVIHAWEARLSKLVHGAMYMLLVAVPLMGYAMSSSYSQSDGVTFFGFLVQGLDVIQNVPEVNELGTNLLRGQPIKHVRVIRVRTVRAYNLCYGRWSHIFLMSGLFSIIANPCAAAG